MYTTQSTLLHNFKNSLKRTVCIEVTKNSWVSTCSCHVFTNFESTNPRIFFTKFFLFSFKTRYDFSIEIKNLARTVYFQKKERLCSFFKRKQDIFPEKKIVDSWIEKSWKYVTNKLFYMRSATSSGSPFWLMIKFARLPVAKSLLNRRAIPPRGVLLCTPGTMGPGGDRGDIFSKVA